jgi:hypothetical protein
MFIKEGLTKNNQIEYSINMKNNKFTILVIIIFLFLSCRKETINNIVPEIILPDIVNEETTNNIVPEIIISDEVFLNVQPSIETDEIMSYLSIGNQYNTLTQGQGNLEWYYPYSYTQHYFFGFEGYSNAILSESEYYARESRKELIHWTLRLYSKNGDRYITFGGADPENINKIEDAGYNYSMSNGRLIDWKSGWEIEYARVSDEIVYGQNNEIHIVTWLPSDGTMPPNLFSYINISRKELFRKYLRLYLDGIDYILDKKWETRIKGFAFWTDRNILEKKYDNDAVIMESLKGLTARELAIFRNYIYARHNYRFRSDDWNEFFRTYYKDDYNGTRTNDEVLDILTDHEKHILELVIEQERRL